MESTTKTKARRARQHLAASALALAGLAATATGVLSTGALFTDNDVVSNNSFTTGNVDIASAPATSAITMGNMSPGDVAYGEVTVSNSGSLGLRYAVSQSATNTDTKGLASALNLQVKAGLATCDAAAWATGTSLNGTGSTFATATVFGSATSGQQTGDRSLNAGASEKLCFRAELSTSAGNGLQGATTTGTFTFSAEQTKNN